MSLRLLALTSLLSVLAASACSAPAASDDDRKGSAAASVPVSPPRPAVPTATPGHSRPRIVCLGDSLTAGLGLAQTDAYPALLQRRLDEKGIDYEVVNAGVSGDTSAGGLERLDWALDGDVRVLIVALGGNDALRALPTEQLHRNLATIIERAQGRGITVVLAGMEAPPNFGRDYIVSFHKVYPALAKEYRIAFVPFLLQGVAGVDALNQRDGIHPTAEGARILADNIWAALEPIVEARRSEHRAGS
jgi:acyl-CoA thioesterase-1